MHIASSPHTNKHNAKKPEDVSPKEEDKLQSYPSEEELIKMKNITVRFHILLKVGGVRTTLHYAEIRGYQDIPMMENGKFRGLVVALMMRLGLLID